MLELLEDNVTAFIVIDALDECEETKLLEHRTMIEAWNLKCTVKVLCTSRLKPDIEATLATASKINMNAAQVSENIRIYVQTKLRRSTQEGSQANITLRLMTLIVAPMGVGGGRPSLSVSNREGEKKSRRKRKIKKKKKIRKKRKIRRKGGKEDGPEDQGQVETEPNMKENVAEVNNDEKHVVIRADLAANTQGVASYGYANQGLTQELA
ncbi:hypothetical protein BGX38DRAFT_1267652 [Terfezia claveryi]|nr:hypothetical protein BGX38DRAFT_1267652 [Terfezia claveryi]